MLMRWHAVEIADARSPSLMCTEDGESFACRPTDLGISGSSKKLGRDVRKVVKDYGLVDCEDQVAKAWLNTRFAKDYPPMPRIPSGDGWISPSKALTRYGVL